MMGEDVIDCWKCAAHAVYAVSAGGRAIRSCGLHLGELVDTLEPSVLHVANLQRISGRLAG